MLHLREMFSVLCSGDVGFEPNQRTVHKLRDK